MLSNMNPAAFLILTVWVCLADSINTRRFTIGALFDEDKYGLQTAFEAAINRSNEFYRTDIKFESVVRHVGESDAFAVSKILCNMMQEYELLAVVGPQSPTLTRMVQSICSKLEIPHIQINYQSEPPNLTSVLNFYPEPRLLAVGIATVIKNMKWKNYAILYESSEGLARLQDVLRLHEDGTEVLVKQLYPGEDNRLILKEIRNITNAIILDCEADHILDILQQAQEVKLLDYQSNVFLSNLDAHTLDYSTVSGQVTNFTTIRITDTNSIEIKAMAKFWNYMNSSFPNQPGKVKTATALMHDAMNYFIQTVKEYNVQIEIKPKRMNCALGEKSVGLGLVEFMRVKSRDNALTGPLSFAHHRRTNFRLDILELLLSQNNFNKTAEWRSDSPNDLYIIRSESEQRQQVLENLASIPVVKVTTRLGPPYLRRRIPQDGETLTGNDQFEGYSKDLIARIASELNFTYEFMLTEDGLYANLIRDLLERRAHLAICDLTSTHERSRLVDFSAPFMNLGVSILYSKSPKQDPNKFAFMDPFDFEVWMYTVTLYLGVSISIYVISRMAPGDWENPHPCNQDPEELENIWDLKNCFWLTLGSIMTQGCDILPKGISSRMGTSMWWFFSLIITSSYTANLAAFLTMERMGTTINNADDLAKQTKIKYGTVANGATQAFFRESNFSTFARMWTQMEQNKPSVFESSNADGVKRVNNTKNQLYAFLMEDSSIEYEIEKNCNLRQVGGRLDQRSYGIAMPMHTPYRSLIDNVLLKLQESGELRQLKHRWWKEKVEKEVTCDEDDVSDAASAELALANVGGVFIVLGMGTLIAFGLAILEFLWNIKNVAVEEHITYFQAFLIELKFAVNIWVTRKRVKPLLSKSSSPSKESDDRSVAQKMLHGAGSFLNIDSFDKASIDRKE